MRTFRSYWYYGLIGGVALLALGPAQINPAQKFTRQVNLSHASTMQPATNGTIGPPTVTNTTTNTLNSNWAGYGLGGLNSAGATFFDISGSQWSVPAAQYVAYAPCGTPPCYEQVSVWIGVGGNPTGNSLLQVGTTSQVDSNFNNLFFAWYEEVPGAPAQTITCNNVPCPVTAGDRIAANMDCIDPGCSNWEIQISDLGQNPQYPNPTPIWSSGFSLNPAFQPNNTSVEWIAEGPQINSTTTYPLPNFGTVTFLEAFVNGGTNQIGVLNSTSGAYLTDPSGGQASPCAVANAGSFASMVVGYGYPCLSSYVYPKATHNFDGSQQSGIPWQDNGSGFVVRNAPTSYNVAIWTMPGNTLFYGTRGLMSGGLGPIPTTWSIIGQRDFNGDGYCDFLWRDSSGDVAVWLMNDFQVISTTALGNVPSNWNVYGTGDYNGDSIGDILWRDSNTGTVAIWFMNSSGQVQSTTSLGAVPSNWTIVESDGNGNIFWRDSNTGDLAIWKVSGGQVTGAAVLGTAPSNWQVVGVGDFNGDGVTDILWRDNNTGTVAIWFLNTSLAVQSSASLGVVTSTWNIAHTGDYNGDGVSDIFWIDTTGDVAIWYMSGGQIASTASFGNVGTSWNVPSANSE
jgi:hypothetical protein